MVQHILLGDLAALALVAGLTGPILRPVLALPRSSRSRVLAHPLVALPLWARTSTSGTCPRSTTRLWVRMRPRAPAPRVLRLRHADVGAGGRGAARGRRFGTGAKLGYIVVVRLLETVLGNVFLWGGSVFYETYERRIGSRRQGLAGG